MPVFLRLSVLLVFIFVGDDTARGEFALKGEADRPFPSLMPLDYPYCRAVAWIEALRKAEEIIPPEVANAMKFLKLEGDMAYMALCSLACPVEKVTPEESAEGSIGVYLKKPASGAFHKVMEDPALLILQTGLLFDTFAKINYLSRNWPKSLTEAREERDSLEREVEGLDCLWQFGADLKGFLERGPEEQLEELEKILPYLPDSALINFLLAQALERTHMPQAAIQAADKALEICLGGEAAARDKLMAAQIYYVRALALLEMNQPALAEVDLESAIAILENAGIKWELLPKVHIAHGRLRATLRDWAGMCQDFIAACAWGVCHHLSRAIAEGHCNAEELRNDKPLTPDNMSSYMP